MIVYTDMVADLYHYGHINWIQSIYNKLIKNTDNKLYVGIHSDETVMTYKRKPIMILEERIKSVSCIKLIDQIIPNAPLYISKEYINKYNISVVCVPSNRTQEELNLMCNIPYKLNMIQYFDYDNTISTTQIINRIKKRTDL
tara:strand:- start:2147 stop:2572 length:426 start_codon:yes stop_codon:yes gene_type:complete